jgi:hypothetical protein
LVKLEQKRKTTNGQKLQLASDQFMWRYDIKGNGTKDSNVREDGPRRGK